MNTAIETETVSTAERVAIAAHEMLRNGQGQAITQRAIYEAIGNRGSMTTIQQALGDWWTDLGTHLQQLEYLQGFPPEVLSPLLEAFAGIRELAETQARAEHEAAIQEARGVVEEAHSERDAARGYLEIANHELQKLRHQVDQLVEKRDALQQQLDSETDRRQAIEAQIPAIRKDAQDRIQQAEQQKETLQAALEKEETRHQATEARLTTLYDQERTTRAQAQAESENTQRALQEKLEDLNQAYLQAQQDGANLASQLSQEVSRRAGQVDQLEAARQQLQAQLEKSQAEQAELAASLAAVNTERRYDQARIRDLEQGCATLESASQEKDQAIQQLTTQVAKLQDHKESE